MKVGDELHLGYCTNIHAGESWPEVRASLETHLLAVRARVAPGRRFGVGLRLSAIAAEHLEREPGALDEFQRFLAAHDLYVFTINGFPYGPFHGTRVKEEVYLPDWRAPERVEYSDRLARLLAALLPDDVAEGSVSTVPGAFGPNATTPEARAVIAANILRHAATLHTLEAHTGRTITLALEPEPACLLETISDGVAFFEEHLLAKHALEDLARATGQSLTDAERFVRAHVGLCLDACHASVEFEDPLTALDTIARAGLRVPKIQLSAGLDVPLGGPDHDAVLAALRAYDEGVYLHQVVEHRPGHALTRFVDLPEAFASRPPTGEPRTWRVHFHVPLFRRELGLFRNTQADLERLLARIRAKSPTTHLEVETYTWDVLPPELRQDGLVADLARELAWVLERL
ncbi:metabolite traffic protein EboE [Myxococcota bacterium]|nr:metabolite traffic protein EboE [Myxococcota bacterium]